LFGHFPPLRDFRIGRYRHSLLNDPDGPESRPPGQPHYHQI
jgi:hypothetical protein